MGPEDFEQMTPEAREMWLLMTVSDLKEQNEKAPWIQQNDDGETQWQRLCQRVSRLEDHERIVIGVVCVAVLGSGVLVWALTQIFRG